MHENFHGLIIGSKIYPVDHLADLCENMLSDNSIPQWEKKVYSFISDWISDKDYILQVSSGSTGIPKEIRLPKKSMILSAQKTCELFNLKFGQTALLCLPIDYIAGKMMVVRAIVGGLNLVLTEPTSMPDLTEFGKIDFLPWFHCRHIIL
jgi:O-succinylbenzoic acid--CoA ligase